MIKAKKDVGFWRKTGLGGNRGGFQGSVLILSSFQCLTSILPAAEPTLSICLLLASSEFTCGIK